MRTRSCEVMADGGEAFRDKHKANNLGVVSVITDDAQIDVGWLLSEGTKEARILIAIPAKYGRQIKYQIVRILKRRMTSFRKRG